MKRVSLGLFLVLFLFQVSRAQESNYWFQNFGALSTIRGGIEVASVQNVSAAFYNPGALAFIEGEFLEGQADVVTLDGIYIENAGGDDIGMNFFTTNIQPSMLGYLRKIKKNPKWVYSVAGLTRYDFNHSFLITHEQLGDYIGSSDDTDVFQGQYRYNNRTRENWVIGAFGYRVSKTLGVGLATNFFIRTTDYFRTYTANAFAQSELEDNPEQFDALVSQVDQERLDHRALGFILKPSVNLQLESLKLGATFTMPAINLGLLNNFTERAQQSIRPDEGISTINIADAKQFYQGVYKTPFSINVGASYDFGKWGLSASAEWFAKIDPYDMIKPKEGSQEIEFPPSSDPTFAIPRIGHKSIMNFGLAWEYEITDLLAYIGSFRTDFSHFDTEALNQNEDFVPLATTWDIYHFSSGVRYKGPRTDITLGFNYGNGRKNNYQQFVDMTSASQDNFLRGNPTPTARAIYNNLSLTLGFNFNIDWKKGLETDDI